MPPVTYYVVLPFFRTEDGELVADEATEAPGPEAARRQAQRIAAEKGGAIAFLRTGDPDLGEFEDAIILGRYGDVPDDLEAFTGGT